MTAPPPSSDDYAATTYEDLCMEISDGYLGETGDLVRAHARAVLALRDAPARERARLAAFLTDHAATLDAFVQGSSPTEFVAYLIGLDGPPPPAAPTEPVMRESIDSLVEAAAAERAEWGGYTWSEMSEPDRRHYRACARPTAEFVAARLLATPVAAPTEPRPPFRVMEAHLLQDCANPASCWYEPHRLGARLPVDAPAAPSGEAHR